MSEQGLSAIERYDFGIRLGRRPSEDRPEEVLSKSGDWVRHSDHEQALAQARQEERERVREATQEPIHDLATHIGRGRVFADNDEPKLARRELDCAAEAMSRLRAALDTLKEETP